MKLLLVHDCLGAQGGAETDLRLTAAAFQRRGHTVGLLYARGTGRDEEAWRSAFSECFRLAVSDRARSAETALKDFAPDVVYFYGSALPEVFAAILDSGVPVVRRIQDHAMYCMRGYKYNFFTRAICTRPASRRCVFPCLAFLGRNHGGRLPFKWVSYADKRKEIELHRQCRRLIVYSRYQKDELIRNGFDPAKIEISVPINFQGAQQPCSSFSDRNLVLYAGQIIRGKGVDLLLRALAKVRVPFECSILGEGNHRAHCERLCARLGLRDRVRFRGFINAEEMKQYYREASVVAVTSVWPEPFGMAGPEAMLYGLPVVAFDAGGIREWLIDGENGFLVPWMDTDLFAARIEKLLLHKDLAREMGRNARQWVSDQFDSDHQFGILENILERVRQEARSKLNENTSTTIVHELCG